MCVLWGAPSKHCQEMWCCACDKWIWRNYSWLLYISSWTGILVCTLICRYPSQHPQSQALQESVEGFGPALTLWPSLGWPSGREVRALAGLLWAVLLLSTLPWEPTTLTLQMYCRAFTHAEGVLWRLEGFNWPYHLGTDLCPGVTRIWSLSHNLNVPFNLQFKVLFEAHKFLPVIELLFNTGNNCIISHILTTLSPVVIASAQSNLLFQSIKLVMPVNRIFRSSPYNLFHNELLGWRKLLPKT